MEDQKNRYASEIVKKYVPEEIEKKSSRKIEDVSCNFGNDNKRGRSSIE